MSRQEDFKKAADDYVEGEPDGAQKIVGQVGFEFGAEHGYQYALQHPHWIPVEERLPKFDEQVLVYGLCPNGCRLFYVDCLIQDINDNGYPKWDDDTIIPTHWMEIVPPRKEDKE